MKGQLQKPTVSIGQYVTLIGIGAQSDSLERIQDYFTEMKDEKKTAPDIGPVVRAPRVMCEFNTCRRFKLSTKFWNVRRWLWEIYGYKKKKEKKVETKELIEGQAQVIPTSCSQHQIHGFYMLTNSEVNSKTRIFRIDL